VKRAPWEPYLPVYFWAGGLAAGGWLAATAEEWAGEGERETIRAGRYLALGGVLAGTALLIADLGRPERFHHMLRIVQPRSAMSLGSWGLAAFGAAAGGAAALQLMEDLTRPNSRLVLIARGGAGRALHLAGLPLALFLGSYTGTLLASTSTPAWARRRLTLPPLFLASAVASGLTATAAIVEARASAHGSATTIAARRRLARASTAALAAEIALSLADSLAGAQLPSRRVEPRVARATHALTLIAGTGVPLILTALQSRHLAGHGGYSPARSANSSRTGIPRILRLARRGSILARERRHTPFPLLAAALALGGSLALRYRITREGYHSAGYAPDTWALAQRPEARSG
jgi:formate-dependent nitrite reductase membrane component NrfD